MALEGGEGSASRPGRCLPREIPGTHCTGGWVGPRAGLDRCGKYRPPPGFDPRTVQPVTSRYTEWVTRTTGNCIVSGNEKYNNTRTPWMALGYTCRENVHNAYCKKWVGCQCDPWGLHGSSCRSCRSRKRIGFSKGLGSTSFNVDPMGEYVIIQGDQKVSVHLTIIL
jgi:hypothetical protein